MSDRSVDSSPSGTSYQSLYDWGGDQSLSSAVVFAVAEATGRDYGTLPPLYERVDPDALDDLFSVDSTDPVQSVGFIAFSFAGCWVTVQSNGRVIVETDTD